MSLISLLLLFNLFSEAAPHPGVGSSAINQLQNGSLFSQMGFKLTIIPSGWQTTESARSEANKELQIDLSKNFSVGSEHLARISFKSEQTKVKVDLETYVKKFLRDYNQYGFDVSGLQSLRAKSAVIVDINQKNKKTRSRQMFFQNANRIVTATCIDEFDNFDKAIAECNQIFNGLIWK